MCSRAAGVVSPSSATHEHRRLLRVPFGLPIAIGDSVVRGIERIDPWSWLGTAR
jgi:hypothetical protein